MATADELLAAEHVHGMTDSDAHYKIDPTTRELKTELALKKTIVQHDHNSEKISFSLPKTVDGHDMMLCNQVRVHYINIDAKTKEERPGLYDVTDLQPSTTDENTVVCSWTIARDATQLVGILAFAIRFACLDENGEEVYGWGTVRYEMLPVSQGVHNSEVIYTEYFDILDKWRKSIEDSITASIMEKAIPAPLVAEIGQTIVVTEIDGTGKPIAWEAVNLPSGEEWETLLDLEMTETTNCVRITEFPDGGDIRKIKKMFVKSWMVRDEAGNGGADGAWLGVLNPGLLDYSGGICLCPGIKAAGTMQSFTFLEVVGNEDTGRYLTATNIMSSHSNTYGAMVYKTGYNDARNEMIAFDNAAAIQIKAFTWANIYGPGSTLKIWAIRDK